MRGERPLPSITEPEHVAAIVTDVEGHGTLALPAAVVAVMPGRFVRGPIAGEA